MKKFHLILASLVLAILTAQPVFAIGLFEMTCKFHSKADPTKEIEVALNANCNGGSTGGFMRGSESTEELCAPASDDKTQYPFYRSNALVTRAILSPKCKVTFSKPYWRWFGVRMGDFEKIEATLKTPEGEIHGSCDAYGIQCGGVSGSNN